MKFCMVMRGVPSTGVCPFNTMAEFRDFINCSALMDPPLGGGEISRGLGVGTR